MILSLHECWCQKELEKPTSLIGGKVRISGPPGTPWDSLPMDLPLLCKGISIVSFVYYRYVLNKYSED